VLLSSWIIVAFWIVAIVSTVFRLCNRLVLRVIRVDREITCRILESGHALSGMHVSDKRCRESMLEHNVGPLSKRGQVSR